MDNDGPSDEEASSLASPSIASPPATQTNKPNEDTDSNSNRIIHTPRLAPLRTNNHIHKRDTNSERGRHEGKIIEISSSPPPTTKQPSSHYESFLTNARSRSTSAETKQDIRTRGRGTPGRTQVLRARQVLVHYHPQMGDEGYESTLLESSSSTPSLLQIQRRPRPTADVFPRDSKLRLYEKQWNKAGGGGMHSRMIDDIRYEEGEGGGRGGNDETDNAATRQLRRRVLRMTLEGRSTSAEEKRRRMRSAEADVGGASFGGDAAPTISAVRPSEDDKGDIPLPTPQRRSVHPHNNLSSPSSYDSRSRPPPPPPHTHPSHRQIVAQLIQTNEPEKLSQLDRVLQKYSGREDELIAKLDLRYRKKKKKKKSLMGGENGAAETDAVEVPTISSPEEEHPVRHSPRKDRNAILTMQSWDRRQDEKEFDKDDEEEEEQTSKKHGCTVTAASERAEQEEENANMLSFSARTSSTRTELHSNLERDVEDSEGRLPKVPENEAKVPESEAKDRHNTPTRAKDGEKGTSGSPGFSDDISLITMETKGTMYRNRGEGGGVGVGEGEEGVYSYAEMMRRPPASIIVDGNASCQPPQDSPASMEKDLDDIAKSIPQQQQQQQLAPPKIQRLLPEYEKISEQEKAEAAEASQVTSALLDSVEARIRARHELRREEEARKSEYDAMEQSTTATETKTPEEHTAMAFDEEESFVGKSNRGVQRSVIEHSSSLIDEEANRRGVLNGVTYGGTEEKDVEGDVGTNASQKEKDSLVGKSYRYEGSSSFDAPVSQNNGTDQEDDELGTMLPVCSHFVEQDISRDNENDRVPNHVGKEGVEEERSVVPAENAIEYASNEDLAEKQREEEQARAIQEAARREAENQLQIMQDEIARLVAEKESRFAAEKAVALKKAEKALEEERKARLEAEEAKLKAERELERLKAEAEERLNLLEAAKVAELSRAEEEIKSERMSASAEESSVSIIPKPEISLPTIVIDKNEEHMSSHAMPGDEDSEGQPVAKNEPTIETPMAMDAETKEELLSMIAEMEERTTSHIKDPSAANETDVKDQVKDEDDDSVDIVERMRAVWASDDDESQQAEYGACSYDESEYENQEDRVEQSTNLVDDDDENDSDHSDDHSYLPGSLQSSPERKTTTLSKDLHDYPSLTMPQVPLNLASLQDTMKFRRSSALMNEHDFPSMRMPHRQVSAAQILDTAEPRYSEAKVTPNLPRRPSIMDDEEGEANIYHVARVTFDGDPRKGQLSFISGSEVLAHSNQRGDWWLGRCGGRTGWFPASAVVPASEFLRGPIDTTYNAAPNAAEDDDIDLEFPKLSEEELDNVYDFIRSPSGDDDSPKRVCKDSSPPSFPVLEPSQVLGLNEGHESAENEESDVKLAFDSMMNVYDSMVKPASPSDGDQQINGNDDVTPTVTAEIIETEAHQTTTITESNQDQPAQSTQEKKPKRYWRSALDPNTGLTYYYHIKTRETTWDKPPDFVEKKSPATKSRTSVESKPTEQESGPKEATTKEKSGSKRFLGLFSKPSAKKSYGSPNNVSDRKVIHSTVPQSTKPTNERQAETKHTTNNAVSSHNDDSDEDDVSSVSSEETSTSIFSTKRMREAIVKVTSKIAGKITTIQTNNSYDVLDDGGSQRGEGVKGVRKGEQSPACNAKEEAKEEIQPYVEKDESIKNVTCNPDRESTTSASSSTAAQRISYGKKNDSRWRAAVDPLTGRTYYFHKDTQETVWEKPKNL